MSANGASYPFGIGGRKGPMGIARTVATRACSHSQGHAMSVIEVVEVHFWAPIRKREHKRVSQPRSAYGPKCAMRLL